MSTTLPGIERLPTPTQTKLRSTQILTSLAQIVSELLQNSLDAHATHIDIGLDLDEWMCWIVDNGYGIPKDDLETLAQASENSGRYYSSKSYGPLTLTSSSTFGFRGEALASAADVSCLEISSRTSKSRNTWSAIMKGGKVLYQGAAVRWKRESPGTAVCVRDAFYNLPVRRQSHTSPSRTLELVRKEIETYSLMFPEVSFTMEDLSHTGDSQHKNRIFRIPKTNSPLGAFRYLFGAALAEHVEEINVTNDSMKMEGFISLSGAPSKVYQFLYINRHPITIPDLNRAIESQFALSSFGKNALDEEQSNKACILTRRSPRKSEKKPVYVLNIFIATSELDNHLDPSKSLLQFHNQSNVIRFLSSTVRSFLQKHGFLVRDYVALERYASPSPSPRKRMKLKFNDSGNVEADAISEISGLSLQDTNQSLETKSPGGPYASVDGISEQIIWEDPATGERFVVDSRTGNSFSQATGHLRKENEIDTTRRGGRRTLRQHKTNDLATNLDFAHKELPTWLKRALENNKAYTMTDNTIPSTQVFTKGPQKPSVPEPQPIDKGCYHPQNISSRDIFKLDNFEAMCTSTVHRFTREDVRQAEIINQVDRKFIACRVTKRSYDHSFPRNSGDATPQPSSVLVFIDQHAADERVRVERFLKELFVDFLTSLSGIDSNESGVRFKELNPPQPILLTKHEALIIKRSQDGRELLRKWGVRFAELSKIVQDSDYVSESGSSTGYSQLLVSSIPDVVSDKLLQGDELRDFVKGFLSQIQSGELFSDSSNIDLTPGVSKDEFFWLKAMRRCPKALLDLVNSKACRGAIMFNDTLSISQCERLVKQLSETAFPFQCAHGRPSLVPLVEVRERRDRQQRHTNNWVRLEAMGTD